MSAVASPAWEGPSPPPHPVRRLSVDDYHRMIDAGVLTEDDAVELLEGWLAVKMVRGSLHDAALGLINRAIAANLPPGWHVRAQMAITTGDSEPEPDLAIVRGDIRDYNAKHPNAGDVALVIEVADASLARDREVKSRIYARAGIPQYWIINLVEGVVEVCGEPGRGDSGPAYASRSVHAKGDRLQIVIGGRMVALIGVDEAIP